MSCSECELINGTYYCHTCEKVKSDLLPPTRRYLPTLADLLDRLSILQLKVVFIPENKKAYAKEILDILWDIKLIMKEKKVLDYSTFLNAVVLLAQFNLHIWHNEAAVRMGYGDGDLKLTHSINGIRNLAKNTISALVGERVELKRDCLAEEFEQWMPII